MLAVYLGLKVLFPAEGENMYLLFRFVRYTMIGLWGLIRRQFLFCQSLILGATLI